MSPTIDPSKLKVTELREELQARGLDTKGNKPVLVKRLKKALEDELNKELPDTSIADTSTEDLDCSRTEEADTKEPETEPEKESETVSDQKDVDTSVQENADEPVSENVEASESDTKTNGEGETPKTDSDENKEETQNEQLNEEEASSGDKDVEMKDTSADPKGEKRKRTDDSTESPHKKKVFKITEDEPEIDSSKVLLSWYDSDLHLVVDKQSFLSAKPLSEGLFGYAWAGVRATHGVTSGKVCYEVKLTDEMQWVDYVNQRKDRYKDKRIKEKQNENSDSKKSEEAVSEANKESDSDKPQEEQMEVTENQTDSATAESADNNDEKEAASSAETKMDTESSVEKAEDKKEEEENEKSEGNENEESSEVKEESSETPNDEKQETPEETKKTEPVLTHLFRVGWSCQKSSLQLGEDNLSYGYESTGKFVSNKEFKDFAVSYKKGDVVGAYLDISADKVEMRFTVNGELQPEVISIPRSELPEENIAFFPHVLSRNISFELNVGTKEEPWFPVPEGLEGYTFVQDAEEKVQGPVRPETRQECEVIMMCGLPGSGKSHWVEEYLKTNEDKLTSVIGASHLLNKMTVHGEPLKSSYKGTWYILMEKLQRCLNRLGDIAAQRRRNYVLDQTHVFPSVQQRKLRAFEGFKRRAVVVVVGDEEYAKRQAQKEAAVGKDIQEHIFMEMKANMALPTQGDLFDEVTYADLNEEEAKAKVSQYNTEGKTYIDKKRKNKDNNKGRFFNRSYNSGYMQRRGNFRDNRGPPRFDRAPRGWIPPPGRNPRDRRPPPPPHMAGGRGGWMRNDRGPPRPMHDRSPRDARPMSYNRNQGGGRPSNWQGGNEYGQGRYSGGQQGNWGYGNQGYGSNYQQQGQNWNANGQNQWKYGNNQGYNQQGYGQNWDNYYGQYPQNWSGQYS